LTADFLDRTLMRSASGEYVPLADLVTVKQQSGFSTVRRENGVRVVTVSGDIDDADPDRAVAINETLRDTILPQIAEQFGVEYLQAGLSEQENQFLNDARTGFILCLLGIYLVLAWIFSSWTRPLVVMSIIPFGLVGAIWGHEYWELALSMFSIVGLIGMTGIIINDAIVLVSTIDEYARDRGMIPAIIDGTADRLRPVFLTTATTVLGLAPLLFERSADAQFLKPTVVTLVYGLGFGMVLVLLVVPALMAMQLDISRQVKAVRRAMATRGAALPVTLAVGLTVLGGGALFFATMVPALFDGRLPWGVAAMFPALAQVPVVPAALGTFTMGMLALVIAIYLGAALIRSGIAVIGRRTQKAGS